MARWLTLVLAVSVAACDATAPPREQPILSAVFPGSDVLAPLPVVVDDRTATIVGVGIARGDASNPDGAAGVPGLPNALAIRWLGGTCDHRVVILVARPARWVIDVRTDAANACNLAGISRAIVLTTGAPIDPNDVDVVIDGRPVGR